MNVLTVEGHVFVFCFVNHIFRVCLCGAVHCEVCAVCGSVFMGVYQKTQKNIYEYKAE